MKIIGDIISLVQTVLVGLLRALLSFLLPPFVLSQGFISCETSFLSQESPRSLVESGMGTVSESGRLSKVELLL